MSTLRRFEYLIAIADQRSFHKAALAANVSQPTLSQQLKLLESELGVTLVDRSVSGAPLTPVGRDIAERARQVVKEVADLKRVARFASKGDAAGTLRFGVSPTIGPYLLPEIVAKLCADKPGLKIHICEGFPVEQIVSLANGDIDLLLAPLPLPLPNNSLHVERLFNEPLRIVAPMGHALLNRRKLEPADLSGQGVLALDLRHPLSRQVAEICVAFDMILLRDYEGTSLDSVYQMAASGLGLAVLPDLYMRSSAGAVGGVRVLNVPGHAVSREIALLWRKEAPFQELCVLAADRIRERGAMILRGATA